MKIFIVNRDYPQFLEYFYGKHPDLENASFHTQQKKRAETFFYFTHAYAHFLRERGHDVFLAYLNNEPMQKAWAAQQNIEPVEETSVRNAATSFFQKIRQWANQTPLRHLRSMFQPVTRSVDMQQSWYYQVLSRQIKEFQPNVVLNQTLKGVRSWFWEELDDHIGLTVGQIASPLPPGEDYSGYDVIVSSLPNMLEEISSHDVAVEMHPLGFDDRIPDRLPETERDIPVSFIGSLANLHKERHNWLEAIAEEFDLRVWGMGLENVAEESPIRDCHQGEAWGLELYRILNRSKISLNFHARYAGPYANNLRLFEVTGCGALLLTDQKENLQQYFEPREEVVSYQDTADCVDRLRYYLEHEEERRRIARGGQERTLQNHTWRNRMRTLEEIFSAHLRA